MSNGKGKERATGVGDDDDSFPRLGSSEQRTDSTISRVVASAKGLASSTLTAPSSNELADSASAAVGSAGKRSQPNAGGNSACAESSKATLSTETSNRALPAAAFRNHSDEHVAGAEAEFSSFLDDTPSFDSIAAVPGAELQPMSFTEARSKGLIGEYQEWTGPSIGHGTAQKSIAEQEAQDGKEVLDLLSNTSTLQDEEADRIYNSPQEEKPVIWKMTELQRTEWHQRLQKDFPQAHEPSAIDVENPLNLVPAQKWLSGQERQQWLEQWEGVLNRYADEVWGDLLPLVKEARDEVETIKEDHGASDERPVALRRLGMILGHLRQ